MRITPLKFGRIQQQQKPPQYIGMKLSHFICIVSFAHFILYLLPLNERSLSHERALAHKSTRIEWTGFVFVLNMNLILILALFWFCSLFLSFNLLSPRPPLVNVVSHTLSITYLFTFFFILLKSFDDWFRMLVALIAKLCQCKHWRLNNMYLYCLFIFLYYYYVSLVSMCLAG